MALRDLLNAEIFSFDARDFANWLKAGIPVYWGIRDPMLGQRVPDAFPYARGVIGRNEAGLHDDLKNIYDQLDPLAKVQMERGVCLLWAETWFKDEADFAIARTLLPLACRLPAKALVDVLPDSLTLFAIAHEEAGSDPAKRQIRQIRRLAFQAAIELVSASARSIQCLEKFVQDDSLDEPLLVRGQALQILRYLGIRYPDRFLFWACIFGHAVVADHRERPDSAETLRALLDESFRADRVQQAIELVRDHGITRIQIEESALTLRSVRGLYDLVPVLLAGGSSAGDTERVTPIRWPAQTNGSTATSHVLDMEKYRNEMRGR